MHTVVLDGFTLNPGDNPWTPVSSLETVSTFTVHDRTDAADVLSRAQGAEILLTNKTPITQKHLASLPAVKFIGVLATGYDVVDIAAATQHGIPVANIPGYGTSAVAEHVFALLMELNRRTSLHDTAIRQGEWSNNADWCFWKSTQHGLAGKTLGIVGFGNTGKHVAEIGHAFGMNIITYAPRPKAAPSLERFQFVDRDTLFTTAHVISLHCPLTPENKQMVNTEQLRTVRNGAIILNTARGQLIDEQAVADALHAGTLGGFGADVVAEEPILPTNPLLNAPNTLLTPHIAWATLEARKRLMCMCAENIHAFATGTPQHIVNPSVLP